MLPGFDPQTPKPPKPKKSKKPPIAEMHKIHGQMPGKTCGKCRFFLRFRMGSTFFKCQKSRITGGAATDWRARWTACGLFQED